MKKIDCATTIRDYEEQIAWVESILSTLEDLQSLYYKGREFCNDDYKEVTNQMKYWEELQQQLEEEKQELTGAEIEENEKYIKAMNYEFERSRV